MVFKLVDYFLYFSPQQNDCLTSRVYTFDLNMFESNN